VSSRSVLAPVLARYGYAGCVNDMGLDDGRPSQRASQGRTVVHAEGIQSEFAGRTVLSAEKSPAFAGKGYRDTEENTGADAKLTALVARESASTS
jgi:hypothetical protein